MTRAATAVLAAATLLVLTATTGHAQTPTQAPAPAPAQAPAPAPAAEAKPDPLVIYFGSGSAAVAGDGLAVLDHASRLYRDGKPIVMIISGSTDSVGSPTHNLLLSQQRDQAVLRGLVARGIPTERFQLLAKGETDPAVAAGPGVAEKENRRVEITWR